MNTDEPETIVIFRKFRNKPGEIIALFPEVPSDHEGNSCQSYMHVGQHSGANYYGLIPMTRRAKPEEYADLYRELTRIGYKLRVLQKAQYRHHENRREATKAWR